VPVEKWSQKLLNQGLLVSCELKHNLFNGVFMIKFLSIIVLFSLSFGVFATDLAVRAAEIVGFGIFDASTTVPRHGHTPSTMAKDDVRGIRFMEYTTDIPAELGVNFGFQYVINSSPKGKPIRVTTVIKFPEGGLQRPGARLYTESRDTHDVIMGNKLLHGYGFDEEWEIVPGKWVFELWYKDARLIKKTFTVYSPDESLNEKELVSD
jgi:hypothetical protein